jgi:autotransporter translocation and assembly factor TamB
MKSMGATAIPVPETELVNPSRMRVPAATFLGIRAAMHRLVAIAGTALLALLVSAAAATAFHDAIAAAVVRAVAAGAGYHVAFERLQVGLGGATALGTDVTDRAGLPVFHADRIELHYDLRDLAPGARRRRFGISALDVERPVVTLIHSADGSYNVTLPASALPSKPDTTPLDVRVRVRDGSVVLIDRFTDPGRERRERIAGVTADAVLSPRAHAFYDIRFALVTGGASYPVRGKATFAAARGFEAQRWTARDLPIAGLVDFALSTHAVSLAAGELHDVDVRRYAFVDPDGTTHAHLGLRARLAGGTADVAGLAAPLRDVRGPLLGYDDGLTTTGIDARLAGVPLHLAGGVYDLAAPKLRFALAGDGEIAQLQRSVAPAQRQPLTGRLSFALEALGSLNAPVVRGTFSAPQLVYRGFPLAAPAGAFAVRGRELQILTARVGYGPVEVGAAGTLELQRHVATNLVVTLRGAGDGLPYVAQVLPGVRLAAVALVSGTGTRLAGRGILYGDAPDGRLDAFFDVDGGGSGVVGPLSVERGDGASLYARVALDGPAGRATGIVDVRRLALRPAPVPPLPGLHVPALPALAGTTLDAQLAGGLDDGRLDALAGTVRVTSPYGTLAGRALSDGELIGFDGRVRSSFARLRPFTGALAAHGDIAGSLQALGNGTVTAVQGEIGLAGGVVTLQGRSAAGAGELIATTSPLDLHALGASTSLPLDGGTVMADVRARGTPNAPRADIALLLDGARWRGTRVSANADAAYAGGTLRLRDATALAFGAYATAAGSVTGLGGRHAPALDLSAAVRGAQLRPLAAALALPLRYPDGELDADLRAGGNANAPHIAGSVRIPAGSLNGLDFSDAAVTIAGTPRDIVANDGRVTVDSTSVAFSGEAGGGTQRFSLRAPHVELADFNDYFDTADTLGGSGHVAFDASRSATGASASGDVAIAGARYRRFDVGDIAATWGTAGRTLAGSARVQSSYGTAALNAGATFPAGDPLRDAAHRTTLAATGTLAGFDLAHWLPVAGLQVPVRGIVDGSARVTGTLAAPAFVATAALHDGALQRYPVDALTLAASGDPGGARITALHVAGPGLTADASGTFGYHASDPLALALRVQSGDVALLAKSLGVPLNVGGAFTTEIAAGGTRAAPRLTQTFDATDLRSGRYTFAQVHAELSADPATLQLRTLDARLARGRLLAAATVPIELHPAPAIRSDAPLSASLRAQGVDLAQFAALLPGAATLGGTLDGAVSATGTLADPAVTGTLTLAGGSYASALLPAGITAARARLDLTRSEARLGDLHANLGAGSLDGAFDATFGDLRDVRRTLAFTGELRAQRAAIDVAGAVRGTVDGTVTADKARGALPRIAGDVTFSNTRLSLAALIPHAPPERNAPLPPLAAFDLHVTAGNDVRVQGPGIDVGAEGTVALGGTLAAPQLDGRLRSTDGQLSFYRTFVLHQSTVAFHPADGLVPDVDATATTEIADPDTQILLHVTGPATHLNLDLSSNPGYDREQILGLLVNAQAFGAVPGIAATPGGAPGISATGVAGSFLGQAFTQNLLQPLGSGIGQSLGLQNLALGYGFGTGVSAGASKRLGKNVYATFAQTFGTDQRQSIALNDDLSRAGTLALTFFNAGNQSPSLLATQQLFAPVDPTNFTLEALQPPPGIAGLVLTFQRKF